MKFEPLINVETSKTVTKNFSRNINKNRENFTLKRGFNYSTDCRLIQIYQKVSKSQTICICYNIQQNRHFFKWINTNKLQKTRF